MDDVIRNIQKLVKESDRILDLGAGTCLFTKKLREKGYNVYPIDVRNRSYYKEIRPEIYDGEHLLLKNNSFDVCLLIAVLHHTKNPEVVLNEAVRVSKKLIIYEDVVTNPIQRFYTYFIDSVLNKELIAPHTNKKDEEWKGLFSELGLNLVKTKYRRTWLFLQNPMYFLEKIKK